MRQYYKLKMSLSKYFRKKFFVAISKWTAIVSNSCPVISAANIEVMKLLKIVEDDKGMKQQQAHQKYTDTEKAQWYNCTDTWSDCCSFANVTISENASFLS